VEMLLEKVINEDMKVGPTMRLLLASSSWLGRGQVV
jgi:hypothetical protein